MREACEIAGVSRVVVAAWRKECERFALEEIAAADDVIDRAEESIYRRGVDGVEEPYFWKGEQVGTIRKYDTPAVALWLQGNSVKYGTRRVEHNISGVVAHVAVDLSQLQRCSDEELASMMIGKQHVIVDSTVCQGNT